jgi:hypothetical protein
MKSKRSKIDITLKHTNKYYNNMVAESIMHCQSGHWRSKPTCTIKTLEKKGEQLSHTSIAQHNAYLHKMQSRESKTGETCYIAWMVFIAILVVYTICSYIYEKNATVKRMYVSCTILIFITNLSACRAFCYQ